MQHKKIQAKTLNIRGGVEDTRLAAKAKDTKKFRGQGHTLSRPRTKDTGAGVLQQKRSSKIFFKRSQKKRSSKIFFRQKRSSKIFFQAISTRGKQKKGLRKFSARFLALFNKISTIQKIVLSSSRGRAIFEELRLRGQGLQIVSSRPRTSSRTPPLLNMQTF